MKRWLAVAFITAYLGSLTYGLGCHTMGWGTTQHPAMYFVVWDMFCGWASYNSNVHLIGEGESEKFYELAPGPWGELHPWGNLGRQHYDPLNNHLGRLAVNTLRHTRHEPITRIYIVEECWAKKYDLPDFVWNMRYDEPKDHKHYVKLRAELTPTGCYAKAYVPWMAHQHMKIVASNPRLQADSRKGKPLFVVEERVGRDMSLPSQSIGGSMLGGRSINSPSGN